MTHSVCEEYNDPNADIVLKSNDNMTFRVHSYHLKAHSSVFRDMLDASSLTQNTTTDKPIDIDFPSQSLRDFLDLLTKDVITDIRSDLAFGDVFKICQQFECGLAGERAAKLAIGKNHTEPWATFCIADKYKDLALARYAISRFESSSEDWLRYLRISQFPLSAGQDVSHSYLLGLIKALYGVSNGSIQCYGKVVADSFKPEN